MTPPDPRTVLISNLRGDVHAFIRHVWGMKKLKIEPWQIKMIDFLKGGCDVTEKTLVYCSWDGEPAILAKYPDGRIHGFYKSDEDGEWKRGMDADIAVNAAVLEEAEFKRRWPNLELPAFSE